MDILTIVADSCRYDTYQGANASALKRYFDIQPASAQATFTYPAHVAMFAGFYPSANDTNRPLYDRFMMSVFRWFYNEPRPHLFGLDHESSIPKALTKAGWDTLCVGGVGWFRFTDSLLSDGFSDFRFEPNPKTAVNLFIKDESPKPRFGLLNSGVTHRPYKVPAEQLIPSPKSGCGYKCGYNEELHRAQMRCLEYLSECLEPLFWHLLSNKRTTLVCFCADHGDCFGEDGFYGHGFYHPKVMEVPLGWTCFHNGEHFPVNKMTIDRVKELAVG